MPIEKKVNNVECARALGVGRSTVTAVRKMLGIGPDVRKVFPSIIGAYLKKNPEFKCADAMGKELNVE